MKNRTLVAALGLLFVVVASLPGSDEKARHTDQEHVLRTLLDDDPRKPGPPRLNPALGGEAAWLAGELVNAKPTEQENALHILRDGKGVVYTEALATAIAQLEGKLAARPAMHWRIG
jgi:hypothetical protein